MRAHDSVANAQAQSRAFGGLFGGVKGIEDAFGIGDAGAVVADGHFDGFVRGAVSNRNVSALSGFLHRVVGVVQNIQEDLLQLLRIAERRGQFFVEVFRNLDAVAGKVIAAQFYGLPQDADSREPIRAAPAAGARSSANPERCPWCAAFRAG